MAVMVPESATNLKTEGEKRLFRLLRDALPDDFRVWYEPRIKSRYPDFVLLAPAFGLLLLEVKDWSAGKISGASSKTVQRGNESSKNPIEQARDYLLPLVNKLWQEKLLLHTSGPYRERPCFPWAYGAVFSEITRQQLDERDLSTIFPHDSVICKDELDALCANPEEGETLASLRRLFHMYFDFPPLSDEQMQTAQGVILPETKVKRELVQTSFALDTTADRIEMIRVLDRDQDCIARGIGDGHRIVNGVAGSGKTVLLQARARMLAKHDRNKRILFLCFNKALAASLRAELKDVSEQVEVYHFDSWLPSCWGLYKGDPESWPAYHTRIGEEAPDVVRDAPAEKKYDAILIDEAQDFELEWFKTCVQALRDPEHGDLLIAVDGAQSLYGRPKGSTWISVGVQARGRSRSLDRNYRNTRELLSFAWGLTQDTLQVADTETNVRVAPREVWRHGPPPKFFEASDEEDEKRAVVRELQRLQKLGISGSRIGILYAQDRGGRIHRLHRDLQEDGIELCWVREQNRDSFTSQPGVRLSTIKSAKGLEFSAVILVALDQLPDDRDTPEENINLLYVALTRAQEQLLMTWKGSSEFTERVRNHPDATRVQD